MALNFRDRIINLKGFAWICIPTFALSQILFYTGIERTGYGNILFRMLLVFTLFFAYNFFGTIKIPNILKYTFPLYCIHPLMLEILNKLFSFVIPSNSNFILVDYFISPIVCVVIIIFISSFLKKKLPKTYSVIFGGR